MSKALIAGSMLALTHLLPALAVPTAPEYTQRRITQNVYGAAFTSSGSVDHLQSSSVTPYPLNKTMWLNFPPQPSNPAAFEWVELGGGKGLTATSIALPNPQLNEQSYWAGHYFTYQRFDSSRNRWYYEGRIGSANPTGSHRYKLERVLSENNKWCSYVDNVGAYCITIAGANNYNSAVNTTIGIESQDNQHSFTNGTGASNIWTYPTNATGFQIFGGTAVNIDNNNRGWYSQWFPLQNGNNGIGFYNQ
ncbi:hypothetical protein V5G28_001310 [Scytonema sp. PRP1]